MLQTRSRPGHTYTTHGPRRTAHCKTTNASLCAQLLSGFHKLATNAQRAASALLARCAYQGTYRANTERIKGAHVANAQRLASAPDAWRAHAPRMENACTAHSTRSQRTGLGNSTVARLVCCHMKVGQQGGNNISITMPRKTDPPCSQVVLTDTAPETTFPGTLTKKDT